MSNGIIRRHAWAGWIPVSRSRRWSLEKENLVAAQENYRIAIDRYKLGELSGIELREAQNSLLEAEERLSVAEYSTKICEISLLQLSGQILTYIRPEPEKASF